MEKTIGRAIQMSCPNWTKAFQPGLLDLNTERFQSCSLRLINTGKSGTEITRAIERSALVTRKALPGATLGTVLLEQLLHSYWRRYKDYFGNAPTWEIKRIVLARALTHPRTSSRRATHLPGLMMQFA